MRPPLSCYRLYFPIWGGPARLDTSKSWFGPSVNDLSVIVRDTMRLISLPLLASSPYLTSAETTNCPKQVGCPVEGKPQLYTWTHNGISVQLACPGNNTFVEDYGCLPPELRTSDFDTTGEASARFNVNLDPIPATSCDMWHIIPDSVDLSKQFIK